MGFHMGFHHGISMEHFGAHFAHLRPWIIGAILIVVSPKRETEKTSRNQKWSGWQLDRNLLTMDRTGWAIRQKIGRQILVMKIAAGLYPDAILGHGNEEEVSPSEGRKTVLWAEARRHRVNAWTSVWMQLFCPENRPGSMDFCKIDVFLVTFVKFVWILHREVLNLWLFENQMMLRRMCSQGASAASQSCEVFGQ